jgi:hypothetical protein
VQLSEDERFRQQGVPDEIIAAMRSRDARGFLVRRPLASAAALAAEPDPATPAVRFPRGSALVQP